MMVGQRGPVTHVGVAHRNGAAWVLLAVAAVSLPAGAPPPQGNFPAAIAPAEDTNVPRNAKVFAFGLSAPPASSVGVALTSGGVAVTMQSATEGCCLLTVTPADDLPLGEASALISTAGAEASSRFVVVDQVDTTAPTLSAPVLLDDRPGALVAAVEGEDDLQLAGFLARVDDAIVSAVSPDFLLEVRGFPAGTCARITSLDVAGNESEPRTVCDTGTSDEDAGVSDGGTPPPQGGCSATLLDPNAGRPWSLVWLCGAVGFFVRRRRQHLRQWMPRVLALAFIVVVPTACADGDALDGGSVDGGVADGGPIDGGDAGPIVALERLTSSDDYERLQDDDSKVRYLAATSTASPREPVGDGCIFQNAAVYEFHLQYLRAVLGNDFSLDDYTALTLERSTRTWWGGELWWRPDAVHPLTNTPGVLLYLVYANDTPASALTADDVRDADAALKACAPYYADALAFAPGTFSQRQMIEAARGALAAEGIAVVVNPQ